MAATREEVLKKLATAGIRISDFQRQRVDAEYWVDYIVQYEETGKCGSAMFSTVVFIPVISKLLNAVASS